MERAAGRYAQSGAELRTELAAVVGALADGREQASRSADYEQLIAQAARDEARSCYNAAYTSAQAGDRPPALAPARRAVVEPEMR